MSLNYTILVGTMTGTAEIVAEEIQYALEALGATAAVFNMSGLDIDVFKRQGRFIICTSTYGSGDVPDNAKALFDSLTKHRPDLSGVYYAVFGLGDTTYQQTFCFGPKKFDALLASLGANRLTDTFLHNASGGTLPEEDCVEWTKGLVSNTTAPV
jgi:MioC protein